MSDVSLVFLVSEVTFYILSEVYTMFEVPLVFEVSLVPKVSLVQLVSEVSDVSLVSRCPWCLVYSWPSGPLYQFIPYFTHCLALYAKA